LTTASPADFDDVLRLIDAARGRAVAAVNKELIEKQRVPCWNEMIRDLRTVYAPVRQRLFERVRECRIQLHELASLVGSITGSPYW
jgi:transposase